jgi:hypothetical protein
MSDGLAYKHNWAPVQTHTLKELARWIDWAEHHAERCREQTELLAEKNTWSWAIKDLLISQKEIREEVAKRP